MIIAITSSQDPRLDALRLNERQLTTIAQRRSTLAAGRFIAEGDLVVARALAAGYKPEVVLCDNEQAACFDDQITQLGGQCLTAEIEIRREATGLGVPLSALGVFYRPEPLTVGDVITKVGMDSSAIQQAPTRSRVVHCVFRWVRHLVCALRAPMTSPKR
jgi:hypothetical protein